MFNRKSSYALNKKDPNAIVYMDANEAIIRLTREDFASEEEFLKWKSLSDADYHASEKEDHVYANHTLALDELSEEAASIPAADICMEQAHDRVAEIRRSTQKVTQIRKHLTDTQFRRMWMYFVDGMTIDEIGKVEGVSHQAMQIALYGLAYWQELQPTKLPEDTYRELQLLARQYYQMTSLLIKAKVDFNAICDQVLPGMQELMNDHAGRHKLSDFVLR